MSVSRPCAHPARSASGNPAPPGSQCHHAARPASRDAGSRWHGRRPPTGRKVSDRLWIPPDPRKPERRGPVRGDDRLQIDPNSRITPGKAAKGRHGSCPVGAPGGTLARWCSWKARGKHQAMAKTSCRKVSISRRILSNQGHCSVLNCGAWCSLSISSNDPFGRQPEESNHEQASTHTGLLAGRRLRRVWAAAWPGAAANDGRAGSPSATSTVSNKQLPAPDPKFGGVIKEGALQSKPWWAPRPWCRRKTRPTCC
jgi:hypothetical protein